MNKCAVHCARQEKTEKLHRITEPHKNKTLTYFFFKYITLVEYNTHYLFLIVLLLLEMLTHNAKMQHF